MCSQSIVKAEHMILYRVPNPGKNTGIGRASTDALCIFIQGIFTAVSSHTLHVNHSWVRRREYLSCSLARIEIAGGTWVS